MPSKTAKYFIELAVREKIHKVRPDYPSSIVEQVVNSTMKYNGYSKDVLYSAIELAYQYTPSDESKAMIERRGDE